MLPRLKKFQKVMNIPLTQGQFLEEHNKLSPENFKTTLSLLSRFKKEKPLLFKNNNWYIDKFRRPFVDWLVSSELGGNKTQSKINHEK